MLGVAGGMGRQDREEGEEGRRKGGPACPPRMEADTEVGPYNLFHFKASVAPDDPCLDFSF